MYVIREYKVRSYLEESLNSSNLLKPHGLFSEGATFDTDVILERLPMEYTSLYLNGNVSN